MAFSPLSIGHALASSISRSVSTCGVQQEPGAKTPQAPLMALMKIPIIFPGPNMGGKSTLLRQTCLAALLAQVGGWVPADSLELTPVDAIFVRMGARDRIMAGGDCKLR